MAAISHFECSRCGEHLSADAVQSVCPKDGGVLYVRYDLAAVRGEFPRDRFNDPALPRSMWRFAPVLPDADPVSLNEGGTPLFPSRAIKNVWIKDESANPTGTFKARGMSAAVTMAKHYGVTHVAAPSAGNAGGALAAYAVIARMTAHIYMPKDVPVANLVEARAFGADVHLVDGLINDCGKLASEAVRANRWYDVSTLKEPFRLEGKKTMGYEVAEQMGWQLPDVILFPTGGGVGVIGMWKAFAEMDELGWIEKGRRPRMVAVQSSGCAPIVKAAERNAAQSEMWADARTLSAGLRVPKPYGDYLLLDIIKQSNGRAVAVSDDDTISAVLEWARTDGILAAPEGAACLAAYKMLADEGYIRPNDKTVLFNTGSGLKYADVLAAALNIKPHKPLPLGRNIGGIIGPY
jgi:threonine synthase